MNRKSFIKNIAIVGGILVIATILLTGCGKKKDETKTYDKENEVAQNIVSNQNYASNLSTEEKIKIAYYLHSLEGDYSSVSGLSTESILSTLTVSNLKLVNAQKTVDKNAINLFGDYDSSYCEIYVIEEAAVKKAAKDLFDVELTDAQINFKDPYLKRVLKYSDGKYYFMKEQAAGESLTIKNISNEGDTYTFFALSCLDSDEKDLSEYYKYEVVITDGVIKSCREAMETEQEENKKAQTTTNTTANTTSLGTEYASLKEQIKNAYAKTLTQCENVLEYRIEGVEILSSEEIKAQPSYGIDYNENDILAKVSYSTKLKDMTGDRAAGNGRESGDWIIERQACVVYKNGEIIQEGTSF